jgi:hypothetical protein
LVSGFTTTKGLSGARATFDLYTQSWAEDSSQETKKKTVVNLETDILFLMPTEMALAQHKANAKLEPWKGVDPWEGRKVLHLPAEDFWLTKQ